VSKQEPADSVLSFIEQEEAEANALAKELGVPAEDDPFGEPEPSPEPEPAPTEEEPPVVEEKPAEETPVVEEKQPDETQPEQKVEAEKPVVEKERANPIWRELRNLQRALKDKDAEIDKLKAKPEPVVEKPADDEFEDPAVRALRVAEESRADAKKAMERADRIEEQSKLRDQQRDLVDEIVKQETAFKKDHPDYDEASDYLIEARREQFELMGKLDADAEAWMDKNPDLVERHAKETGLDPDDINDIRKAAKDIAFRVAVHNERQQLVAYCKQTGKNVAETVYNLAEKMGRKVAAPVVTEEKPATHQPTPKEKVQQAAVRAEKQKPFTQSLAAISTNTAPAPKKITSRQELLKLPDAELDKLIADWDEKNPDLFEQLED